MDPLDSTILIDRVYQRLLDAIADGSLPPGSRVRQSELAERLGVSRQPVSHALHLLKRQGLVREHGRQGVQVAPVDPLRLRQLYEVRGALDGLAARLAAGRARTDATGAAALREALRAGQDAGADAPVVALVALDEAFHQAVYALSGNPVFAELTGPHWPHLRRSMATVMAALDYRAQAWREHAAIAAAILGGDGDRAEAAAREHALRAGQQTKERLGALAQAAD